MKKIISQTLFIWCIAQNFCVYAAEQKIKDLRIDPAFAATSKKLPLPIYEAQKFRFDQIPWLTTEQVAEHLTLYQGYVSKRNEIAKTLNSIDTTKPTSTTYSEFRSLKVAETFAVNGDILHRLYFENISAKKPLKLGSQMMELILEAFGSLDAYKNDLNECGLSARGWVITAYSLDDNRIHNFTLDAHNQTVPVLVMPLLVLDVYEHAYFIDFGTKRASYIQLFENNINWDVVEDRITKWVTPLTTPCKTSVPHPTTAPVQPVKSGK